MTLRRTSMDAHPDFPWLDPDDLAGLRRYLADGGWLEPGETVRSCAKAGEGNMNLTLRIRSDRRSFILKQARPWVEKYDDIAAPWDRTLFEQRFYQRVASHPELRARMPELLGCDPDARVILLEDLPGALDLTRLYDGAAESAIEPEEVRILARYLRTLHDAFEGKPDPELANREMRALNHEHIYVLPLDAGNGLDLDPFEPELGSAARGLMQDASYRRSVRETGARYLSDGSCLVHGDFFPGSWLRTDRGIRVIDPEFCFFGDREFDLGCALAHLALSRQPTLVAQCLLDSYGAGETTAYDRRWVARYAAAEIMRRLIGVAQLPIPPTRGFRSELLERSRAAMSDETPNPLWS